MTPILSYSYLYSLDVRIYEILYFPSKNYLFINSMDILFNLSTGSLITAYSTTIKSNSLKYGNYLDKYIVFMSIGNQFTVFNLDTLIFTIVIADTTFKPLDLVFCNQGNNVPLLVVGTSIYIKRNRQYIYQLDMSTLTLNTSTYLNIAPYAFIATFNLFFNNLVKGIGDYIYVFSSVKVDKFTSSLTLVSSVTLNLQIPGISIYYRVNDQYIIFTSSSVFCRYDMTTDTL